MRRTMLLVAAFAVGAWVWVRVARLVANVDELVETWDVDDDDLEAELAEALRAAEEDVLPRLRQAARDAFPSEGDR